MPVTKPNFNLSDDFRQLALGLELPEVTLDHVSPEEARLRSEEARNKFETAGASYEYKMLRDEGWPWRQAAYIAWASTPKPRKPKTQEQLAIEVLGLSSDRAISMWRKNNSMIDERVAILQTDSLFDWRSSHIQALNEGAAKGGEDYKYFNHLKLALEIHGIYIPTNKLTTELLRSLKSDSLDDYSDDELDQLSVELIKRMKHKENSE